MGLCSMDHCVACNLVLYFRLWELFWLSVTSKDIYGVLIEYPSLVISHSRLQTLSSWSDIVSKHTTTHLCFHKSDLNDLITCKQKNTFSECRINHSELQSCCFLCCWCQCCWCKYYLSSVERGMLGSRKLRR